MINFASTQLHHNVIYWCVWLRFPKLMENTSFSKSVYKVQCVMQKEIYVLKSVSHFKFHHLNFTREDPDSDWIPPDWNHCLQQTSRISTFLCCWSYIRGRIARSRRISRSNLVYINSLLFIQLRMAQETKKWLLMVSHTEVSRDIVIMFSISLLTLNSNM